MTQPSNETREIWTTGRRQEITCLNATIYTESIVVIAEIALITARQMKTAVSGEFPRHNFYLSPHGGDFMRADAERFPDDGL